MAGKSFEFLFQLSAKLGPTFSKSFKNASQTMDVLQGDLASANKKIKDVSAYQKQQKAVNNSRERVNELKAEYDKLTEEIGDTNNATDKQKKQLEKAEAALKKARDATAKEEEKLQREKK